jgi:hypothetical protein
MAEQACNVIKQGGSSVTIYDLGTGTSFNVSNIRGYQNFTVNNFMVSCQNSSKYFSGQTTNLDNSSVGFPVSFSTSFGINASYNSQTGTFSTSISCTTSGSARNRPFSGSGSISPHVYLITDTSKIKSNS